MTEANLLIVEDELKLAELLTANLSTLFNVDSCATFAAFEELFEKPALAFDVVILDRMLGSHDTLSLLPRFKDRFPQCRVIVLSAISTPAEKAAALDKGADDYLSKPFAWEELVARVRSLLRRGSRDIRFGNITLDTLERTASANGNVLSLSNKEFLLLRSLVQQPGRVFSKQTLFEEVWNMSAEIESNAIETTMTKLRRKLEEAGSNANIRNARNLGYWLEE